MLLRSTSGGAEKANQTNRPEAGLMINVTKFKSYTSTLD